MKLLSRKRFYTYLSGICVSLVMFINGYDASVFNNLQGLSTFMTYMGLDVNDPADENLIGAMTSAYLAASIVAGIFLSPPISHYLGRRWSIFIGCLLVTVASFIQTFSTNVSAFIGGRVVLGIGQGVAIAAGPVLMGEICPADIRGRMLSFWQLMYSVGALVNSYTAFGTKQDDSLGNWQWKIVTLVQAIIPILCCCTIFLVPESPRFLVQKGQIEKAERALRRVREDHEVEAELETIKAAMEWEKNNTNNSLKDLWVDKSIRYRVYRGLLINFGQQLTGQSMMNSYSTKVYQAVFQSDSTVLLINALTYTFGILFTLTCTVFSDKIGRRKMLLISGVGQAIMLLIAATIYITTPTVDGTKTLGVGVAIVVVMFMFTFFYKPGWGATVWIYTSEIFPMSVRGTAFAICSNTQSIAGVVMGQAFPSMFANMGFKSFYVWMGVNILLVIAVYFWFPETKGVPLEEMDALFGGNGKTEEVINNAEEHQYPKSIEKVEIKHDSSDSDSV